MNQLIEKDLLPSLEDIGQSRKKLEGVVAHTPLMKNINLSESLSAQVYLKREDLQQVRSYKIRGAYNKVCSLTEEEQQNGVVCASAGNHAQGVAYSCRQLGIKGTIFMPNPTPHQKVRQVRMFGKENIEVVLTGDTFDDSYNAAMEYCTQNGKTFVHPFDDLKVIEGQGTIGLELLEDHKRPIDFLFLPIGGGGLASGVGSVFKQLSPHTRIIGVEPEGAASMQYALKNNASLALSHIDKFVDGAAVKKVGEKTFEICREVLDDVISVSEGKVCSTILQLYNEEAIVVEPAGALTIAALDLYREKLVGGSVVCVVSGSNNDITRTEEIKERSLLYEGLKHYFIVRFPQRAGALREFLDEVLGPTDDIVHFEYSKKNSREKGPALVGIELRQKEDFQGLINRMEKKNIVYEYLNEKSDLLQYLV
ncbi:threonine ammonia-lyase [Xanthovirga aplysinae]|uniref:threonine ammonia-lyase n=1 Tax=Xanthovirga aplysinae TaxID=2529853 RepID=UPI0012BD7FA9|nr:threonine ammonia-lyase [Xanthovirga aplysinae]MTI32514.1 threonine ammonia-lyase [Xanthovirga aplysinae]